MSEDPLDIQSSYDRVAERYAEEYFSELERKPSDCSLLDEFATAVSDKGGFAKSAVVQDRLLVI